jgi:hypothetical protein
MEYPKVKSLIVILIGDLGEFTSYNERDEYRHRLGYVLQVSYTGGIKCTLRWGCVFIECRYMNAAYGGSFKTSLWSYNVQALRREIMNGKA